MPYPKHEIQNELAKLPWTAPPSAWLDTAVDVAAGRLPLLFRGHNTPNPSPPLTEDSPSVWHATPHLTLACSHWRFKLSLNHVEFPSTMGFLSLFASHDAQKFYPDETLERVVKGQQPDTGETLTQIRQLDRDRHFETRLDDNNIYLGTHLFAHDGLGNNLRLAPLPAHPSHPLRQMLAANLRAARQTPHPPAHQSVLQ